MTAVTRPTASNEAAQETVIVPVVSLEEMPRLSDRERETLLEELKIAEKSMEEGEYVTYSPEWLEQRFREIYSRS
jgi:hypothetical protein